MATITLKYWGYPVEVEYDYTEGDKGDRYTPPTDEEVSILNWAFESEEAIDDLDLLSDRAISDFEDEMCQNIIEHERTQRAREAWLRPYLAAKRRRFRDSLRSVKTYIED